MTLENGGRRVTTIALSLDQREIAADSQETDGGGQKYGCKKLFRAANGCIIATAGGSYAGMLFVEWFEQWEGDPSWEERPDLLNLELEEDFECLVVRPDGTFYTVNRLFIPIEQTSNPVFAIGSGGPAARGAMLAGASPAEAVKIAKQIDTYTGGRITRMKIPSPSS